LKERRIEAGVIPNVSYIRIYEQESNRTRARDNRKRGKEERTPGTRRHKPEDVREFVTVCNLLLLRSGKQTDAGDQAGKINKQKNWEEKVNELVSFVRSKSTTPRIDKRERRKKGRKKYQQHVGSKEREKKIDTRDQ